MIDSISIKNFQSHKHTELTFSPGVNVIIGLSDTGKSAIFRAIVWALFNRPLGDGFRSHWAGDEPTEIEVKFTNGDIIRRSKGVGVNEYHVNGTVLKAFGQEPPQEVLETHKIDRTLNIQSQIDPFFLLQSSSGEVATYLNQIAHLDDIDHVTKGLQSHARTIQRVMDTQTNLCASINEQLEQYQNLDEIKRKIETAERLADEVSSLHKRQERLEETIYRIISTEDQLDFNRDKLKRIEPRLESATQIHTKILELHELMARLRKSITEMTRQKYNMDRTQAQLADLEEQWHKAMPAGAECPLCGNIISGDRQT
jgi:exonuclease SbcC